MRGVPLALALALALAGCSVPSDADAVTEPLARFEHDFTEGAIGNGGFELPGDVGAVFLELWFAAPDGVSPTCEPGAPPARIEIAAPDGSVVASLDASADCPEHKETRGDLAPGDHTVTFTGQAPLVGRVLVTKAEG